MGMYDEVRWDAPLPEGHPADSRLFQTKCLDDPSWDYYVVTPEGHLLLVGNGWEDDAGLSAETDISKGIEVEFHGDLRLCSAKSEYVARFTHGRLECVRPLAEGEPWTAVGAAHVKYFRAREKRVVEGGAEQPDESIPRGHQDHDMVKLKSE